MSTNDEASAWGRAAANDTAQERRAAHNDLMGRPEDRHEWMRPRPDTPNVARSADDMLRHPSGGQQRDDAGRDR